MGGLTHPLAEGGIFGEGFGGGGEVLDIEGAGDEAFLSVLDEVAGAADVGDDDGEAAGLGFEDDISEGVGGAGEEEEIGGCVSGGEFGAGEVAGEDGVGEEAFHFAQVGSISDDEWSDGEALVGEAADDGDKSIQVFFPWRRGRRRGLPARRGGGRGLSRSGDLCDRVGRGRHRGRGAGCAIFREESPG